MIAKRIIAHFMILLIILPPQAVMADMLTRNTLGGAAGAAGVPADSSAANANSVNAAAAASQARAAAQDMLTRNTLALDAVQAMQTAARAAAATQNNAGANPNFPGMTLPDVPDGLGIGGLDFISAVGANSPTQSRDLINAREIVNIQQTQQQAMLEWNTFNIGRQTTLRFGYLDASGNPIPDSVSVSNRIAFNRITDPSGNPSQILGNIEAQGQVYVINQNGIIFGGASEVNTGSLTASALPINQTLVTNGLLNNPDSEFLFSSPDVPATATAYGKIGNVTVQAGAKITAPTSSANVGGRVALIGPNVTNNGSISTPDGQTILAAGMEVGYDAHSSDDPSLRGLDVYVGKVGSYGGTATNNGLISSERGSIVVTGKNVYQNGFIHSTTSVALNGRVDLSANYNAIANPNFGIVGQGGAFIYDQNSAPTTGVVTAAAGSVTRVLPEYASTLKVVGTELALKSQVNMQGLAIYLGAGSVVHAPNANVTLSAGVWDVLTGAGSTQINFVHSSGQVYLDQNTVIDVAGSTGIASSISQYIIEVGLRAAELADVPLQRNSSLRGQTVTVDLRETGTRADGSIWYGTPLANLTGYLGVIERNAGELTTKGGQVNIIAGESVVMQQGARINTAGGYQEFAASAVNTTRLIDDGNLVDIARADPSVVYDGIYNPGTTTTDPRWGSTTSTAGVFNDSSRFENSHLFGSAAGNVSISAAAMALDGSFTAGTVVGPQQLDAAPKPGSLTLQWQAQLLSRANPIFPLISPNPPAITFRNNASSLPAASAFTLDVSGNPVALRTERRSAVDLSSSLLSAQSFGSLFVSNVAGDVTLPSGVNLQAPVGGTVSLHGSNVDVQGNITAPAGSIDLVAYNFSPFDSNIIIANVLPVPAANAGRGVLTIGSASVMSTAGIVINDRADAPAPFSVPRRIGGGSSTYAGGSIRVEGWQVNVLPGSLLDVSGGVLADHSMHYGHAGTVSLLGGRDPVLTSIIGGHLNLGGTLRGLSGSQGGALSLLAPTIQVGGIATFPNTLLLDPAFFSQGGFRFFTLTGLGTDLGGAENFAPAIVIAPGTAITPQVSSRQANLALQNGQSSVTLSTLLLPEGYRNSVSLDFRAPGVFDRSTNELDVRGRIEVGAGSLITTDAMGQVTLHGQTVRMLGGIIAPGGTVLVHGGPTYPENAPSGIPLTTVQLASTASISTAGKTVYQFDTFGRRSGTVHAGGTITVEGNLIADSGALMDVSGAAAILDLTPEEAGSPLRGIGAVTEWFQPAELVPTQVMSNAGTISLKGGEFLISRATLRGNAGGPNAQGGTLSIQSGRFYIPDARQDDRDINLIVAQDMSAFALPTSALGQTPGIAGFCYFGANTFQNGGFDSLNLAGNVEFRGAVTLSGRGALSIADGGIIQADALTTLSAAYVRLGLSLGQPVRDEELVNPFEFIQPGIRGLSYFSPTAGTGRLVIHADLVETGFLSLQNIGSASITARHELRGAGYLDIAGNLDITTGQIVPETASNFTITAYNGGSVSIASSGITPQFPLSAGGRLNIFAQTITQVGTLRAPFGSIRLGWDGTGTAPIGLVTNTSVPLTQQITLATGSTTSVSAIDPRTGSGVVIPYGLIKDGTNWIDPTGLDITATGVPEKSLRVSAQNVTTEAGSTIDIRGGGELYAYRWVTGNGGSKDILASEEVFAILPNYNSSFAPLAGFASAGINAANLGGNPGYTNSLLHAGDKVYLNGSSLLASGSYTLLPARYALLPGALLVTPDTGEPSDSLVKPGGAVQTSGYRFNSLNPAASSQIYQSFEIAPQSVVKVRAEYADAYAQSFISAAQQRLSLPVTRGPLDGGYALIGAQQAMQLSGLVSASGAANARGGRVDVSSPLDIIIGAPGAPAQPGKLVLNAALLSAWNAESLLIGGERDSTGNVTVRTTNLTLDNAGSPLLGTDVLLAATRNLSFAASSSLIQSGAQSAADAFVIGGNGALVRVSGVTGAQTSRTGVTASALPSLFIGANAAISGRTVTLDSTNATTLDLNTQLTATAIQLNSGRISIQLTNAGALQPNAGLVLGGGLLTALQASSSLSLLSYSSIDFYGTGSFASAGALELHAGEIRGFNQSGGNINLTAQNLVLDNSALASLPGITAAANGDFNLTADSITIGKNNLVIDQFSSVTLTASQGVTVRETGSFRVQNALNIITPFLRAESTTTQTISSGGLLRLTKPVTTFTPSALGLGASLTLEGSSVIADTDVLLPSGLISLRATTGDVNVNGLLNAGGVARQFYDVTRYTDAGRVSLTSDAGNVIVGGAGIINLAAQAGGGNAGTLIVNAAGQLTLNGLLAGQGATTGSFEMDVGTLASFADLNDLLNAGAFTAARDLRVRSGSISINGTVNARRFLLALDSGAITVNGTINASGTTGGRIDLIASGGVSLANGSTLNVRGQNFDSAGKGGAIWIESTGTDSINIASGSTLNLGVDAMTATSASRGQFSGKAHLRARQNASFNDLLIAPIAGTFIDASSIEIEGFRTYAFNQANVLLRAGATAIAGEHLNTTTIHNNNTSFMANYNAMFNRLLGGNTAIQSVSVLQPGVEIVNSGGSISLGTTTSAALADWNLATFRYGPLNAAGTLTMRASENLEFYNTLSDGFAVATSGTTPLVERMWLATLATLNTSLPVNSQSWNLRLTSGADLSAANFRETSTLNSLAANTGSLLLGKDAGQAIPTSNATNVSPGPNALTRLAINPTNNAVTTGTPNVSNRFQVIRTGTGDIEVNAGRDVRLLNQFATIYTAGVTVPSPTTVFTSGDFVVPILTQSSQPAQNELGAIQQVYPAQYSMAGGNVSVEAGNDIVHLTLAAGATVLDSSRQLPNNWLLRRGYVNSDGQYGNIDVRQSSLQRINDLAASTTWWVNYSNFFDGIAALGGGNVELTAGRDVQNVSAHAPTNARAARGTPSAAGLLELGGGDVTVTTGRNIDGGIYYVERGLGTLRAGGAVTTNEARSISLGRLGSTVSILSPEAWMPVTLFVGKSSFDINARGDVLLGPVANTFLLPQGLTNRHWYKTYFSTYSADAAVNASSLGGNVTIRQAVTPPSTNVSSSTLALWHSQQLILSGAATYQPWLRLAETSSAPFTTLTTVMPGTLKVAAYSGNINLVGRMNFSPSPSGTIELFAAGNINGLNSTGVSNTILAGRQTNVWSAATLNLSDADPASIPGVLTPYSHYQTFFNPAAPTAINNAASRVTSNTLMIGLNAIFTESGSTSGAFASNQAKQRLHATGLLHATDADPLRLYAGGGDISGLTLFSSKASSILASRDITDIAFYIQNVRASDLTLVSAGRDIIAYNANSPLRTQAVTTGNLPAFGELPESGDIQINGPGTLQVLAGRDLDLGTGANNSDGTGTGINSIGNGRNPFLPFEGADIVLAAGMGGVSTGLGSSNAKFADFIYAIQHAQGILGGSPTAPEYELDGRRYLAELAAMFQSDGLRGLPASILMHEPTLQTGGWNVVQNGSAITVINAGNISVGAPAPGAVILPNSINLDDPALTTAQRDQIAMALYFLALRDAGRDRNNPDSPDVNTYRAGYEAIQTLFRADDKLKDGIFIGPRPIETPGIDLIKAEDRPIPGYVFDGDIKTQARDVRTKSGGNISILAPGGGLELASTVLGETLAPPGIITESGGNISVFADSDVSIGIARIFTLRGGDINIWSTVGNIAAGSSSKTIQSAPPTRVIIDPQSAAVATDLAGLATGGGIGVLATVAGVRPGNVDLIAPIGAVDAGDAGIRATGNLNIAAAVVLNAGNIAVGGTSAGSPSAPAVSTPALGGLASAAAAGAATSNSPAAQQATKEAQEKEQGSQTPSIITVEVLGYGGGEGDEEKKRRSGGAE